MKALVAVDDHFEIGEVPDPQREGPDEVRIRVEAISLNRGETTAAWGRGQAVGWDAFGTIMEESADGQGPPLGARVATWGFSGAWAQQRVVSRHNLAPVPESIGAATAAALPVAGLTALHAVKAAGAATGVRVAVSGATGGVGHLATQLAADAGASVLAVTREPRRTALLPAAFSTPNVEVVASDQIPVQDEINVVIDTVGGTTLAGLTERLADRGAVIMVGAAAGEKASLNTGWLTGKKIGLTSVEIPTPVGADLGSVVELVAAGRLNLQVTEAGSWERLASGSPAALLGPGKAVFRVS